MCNFKLTIAVSTLLGLGIAMLAQSNRIMLMGVGNSAAASSIPVTLVTSKSNFGQYVSGTATALGNQLGTQGCPNFTYCGVLPQVATSMSGNLVTLSFVYTSGTAVTWTAKIGTQTMTAGPVTTAESGKILAEYYLPNCTCTAGMAYTLFDSNSTGGVVIYGAEVSVWAGIATSSPLRTSSSNQASTNTTFTAGSITPSTGDLILMIGAAVGTPVRTSFTAGTGQTGCSWAKVRSDIVSGIMEQWCTWSGSGSFTPQMTSSPTSTFSAVAMVFKSDTTAGTLPSGMYIAGATEIGNNLGNKISSGSLSFEAPSIGNTGVIIMGCGNFVMDRSSSITDSGNSGKWSILSVSTIFPEVATSQAANTTIAVGSNLAADSVGAVTIPFIVVTTGGTQGDCSGYAYDIVGGDASPLGYRMQLEGSQGAAGALTTLSSQVPSVSSGLMFAVASQWSNTSFGITSPSGGFFDGANFAGQSLDGPSLPVQNNLLGIKAISSNAAQTWTATQASTTEAAGTWTAEGITLRAPGATLGPFTAASASGNTISGSGSNTTITPGSAITTSTGDLIAVWVVWDGASTTLTNCTDNVNAGNYSTAIGATTINGSGGTASRAAVMYRANVTGGSTTITCKFSASQGTAADTWISVHAIRGLQSGGTLDVTPAIIHPGSTANPNNCNATGTLNSAASTTGEYLFSGYWQAASVRQYPPNMTLEQENSNTTYGNATASMVVLATTSYTPSFKSFNAPGAYACAVVGFF